MAISTLLLSISENTAWAQSALSVAQSKTRDAQLVAYGAAKHAELFFGETEAAGTNLDIEFEGNLMAPSPALLSRLRLPLDAKADQHTAEMIQAQVTAAYRRNGYDLARVHAVVVEERIVVLIAEGTIRSVKFFGASDFTTLNLQLEFRLPANRYNRFQVKKELKRLQTKYGFLAMEPKIVQVQKPDESMLVSLQTFAPGLDDNEFGEEEASAFQGGYELHIRCKNKSSDVSFGYGLALDPPFGLNLYMNYAHKSMWFEKDRFSVKNLVSGEVTSGFSRARVDVRYVTPPIFTDWFNFNFRVFNQFTSLSRGDLDLASYYLFETSETARLGFQLSESGLLSVGLGVRYDNAFGLETGPETPSGVTPLSRFFRIGVAELMFDFAEEGVYRTDHQHLLRLAATTYNMVDVDQPVRTTLKYRKAFHFGYNDLFLRARGFVLFGSGYKWQDEKSISSEIIKTVPGEARFTPRTLQLGIEGRMSVYRDMAKVSAFLSTAGYTELDREDALANPQMVVVAGPGGNFLIIDTFAFDIYYAIGLNTRGETSTGIRFDLSKVF